MKDNFNILSNIWFVMCKCFQFGQVSSGKLLTRRKTLALSILKGFAESNVIVAKMV